MDNNNNEKKIVRTGGTAERERNYPSNDEELKETVRKSAEAVDYLMLTAERLYREAKIIKNKMNQIQRYFVTKNGGQ